MVFFIDGKDFSDCIKAEGLKWKRNDIDGEGAGRSKMNPAMRRARLAIKWTLNVTCMPLTQKRTQELFEAIEPEFIDVTVVSPRYGRGTWRFYSNNVPATHLTTLEDGTEVWKDISFPLVEQ